MKEIKLTRGKVALVDDDMFDYLMQWKWYANPTHSGYYADRSVGIEGKRKHIKMHRLIANPLDGMDTDHINLNTLDNRRENLRNCTKQQNCINSGKKHGTSFFKGVSVFKDGNRNRIIAQLREHGNLHFLGSFKTEIEAAKAFDIAALYYHGEFAYLNFPKE